LSTADYTAIGARWLMDLGYTNLAVNNPWGLPGTNENINYAFGPLLAEAGRAWTQARLQGAAPALWEENLAGRLQAAGVEQLLGDNADAPAGPAGGPGAGLLLLGAFLLFGRRR